SPGIRQHPDPAADRAPDPARHRPHARPVYLRHQRAPVLVRRVLRQGILGRGILVGVLRRDTPSSPGRRAPSCSALRASSWCGTRSTASGKRRSPARKRGEKYAICPLCAFISSSRFVTLVIIQRLFWEERIWIRRAVPRTFLRST